MGVGNDPIKIAQRSIPKYDYIIAHGIFSWVPKFVQDAILEVIKAHLAPNGIAYISYNVYPGWKEKDILRQIMLMAYSKNKDFNLVKQSLDNYAAYLKELKAKDALGLNAKTLLHLIQDLKKQPDYYIMHEFLEDFNEPFFFCDFAKRLQSYELSYVCEANLNDLLKPDVGFSVADEFLNEHFKDRIESEGWRDIYTNKVFRNSLITHSQNYCKIAQSQIGPEQINKIHLIATFDKIKDEYVSGNLKLDSDFNWLYSIFCELYPASINLGELLRHLEPKLRLQAYVGFLRVLDTVEHMHTRLSTRARFKLEYEVGKTALSKQARAYISYFASTPQPMLGFSDEFGRNIVCSSFDAQIMLEFDGKNSLKDIANLILKKAKAQNQKISSDNKTQNKKSQKELALIYAQNIANTLSHMYFLEPIS